MKNIEKACKGAVIFGAIGLAVCVVMMKKRGVK